MFRETPAPASLRNADAHADPWLNVGFRGVSSQTAWYVWHTHSFIHKVALETPLHRLAWTPCVSLIDSDRFLENRLPAVHSHNGAETVTYPAKGVTRMN